MPNAIFSAIKAIGERVMSAAERAAPNLGRVLPEAEQDSLGAVANLTRREGSLGGAARSGAVSGRRLENAPRDGLGTVLSPREGSLGGAARSGRVTGKKLETAPRDGLGALRNNAEPTLNGAKRTGRVTGKRLEVAEPDGLTSTGNYQLREGKGASSSMPKYKPTARTKSLMGSIPSERNSLSNRFSRGLQGFASGIPMASIHGLDTLAVSAVGGVIGGVKGAMDYNPEQERDPLLSQTPVIGRFKAAATGAIKGAAIGATGALGAKTVQFGARAMLSPEARNLASTETLTGAFVRGFKGMNAPGDIPIDRTVARGKQAASGSGYFSFSKIHGKAIDEAEEIIAEGGTSVASNITNGARQKTLYGISEDIGLDVNIGKATNARGMNYEGVQQFRKLDEMQQGLVGATELPGIVASAIGGIAGTVTHAARAGATAYKKHIIDPSKEGKAVSAGLFNIKNPNYPSNIPGVKEEIRRDITAPFVAGTGILGAAVFGVGGAMAATSYGAPAGHPMNAIFRTGDAAVSARAQMEADSAQKIKMQRPTMLGLNDTDEAYFTNPALKPRRENRHTPGKYNDDGSLVFALSNLRRSV